MNPNRLAFAALGFTCIAAAAGGGYLASRHDAASVAVAATTPAEAPAQAVHETEAVIGDTAKPVETAAPSGTADAVTTSPVQDRRPEAAGRSPQAPPPPQRPARRAETTAARSQPPPVLERTWPSSQSPASPDTTPQQAGVNEPAQPPPVDDRGAAERSEPGPEPPKAPDKTFDELVVSANSVIGLQLEGAISSERARVEDRIEARVVRDVRVGNDVAIPAGSNAIGSVMVVERGGKFKERARLGIRFHTLVLADGTRLPMTSETIYRYGESPTNESAAKIGGGAVAGAILGAILGGAKGAAVGATAGAGGGTAAVMAGGPNAAAFPAGTEVTARILSPVTVTVER
jgi:hypothetical protein